MLVDEISDTPKQDADFNTEGGSMRPSASSSGWHLPLVVAAALVLAAGVLALLFGLFIFVVGPAMDQGAPQDSVAGGVYMLLASLAALAIGLGLLMARRWARRLGVLMAAATLVIGILSLTSALFFMPGEMGFAAGVAVALILLVPFVAAPLALWILLSRPSLIAHIEARDPLPGWTESHPLPLLGLILFLAVGALSAITAFQPLPRQVEALLRIPTALWRGWVLVNALASALLVVGLWKRDLRAWWSALLWLPLSSLLGWLMMDSTAPMEGGMVEPGLQQGLDAARRLALMWPIASVAWLLWVRPNFIRKGTDADAGDLL